MLKEGLPPFNIYVCFFFLFSRTKTEQNCLSNGLTISCHLHQNPVFSTENDYEKKETPAKVEIALVSCLFGTEI